MCERIRPLFELKQQGARLFDRSSAIVCCYQHVNPVKDLQASSLSPSHTQRIGMHLVSESSLKEHGPSREKDIAQETPVNEAWCAKRQARIQAPPR
ncbi:hypothetical protein EH240_31240 [Mesorhizobium tamadayense]|uniref:Uncharacterized protein n=1 Tax=Mesorhizobium tamadayense TaxID=425306 RepID=A0A3P3F0K8_9HYPH|nr:hypothetical protein EH240_31240 [Mesorhizobium tamadayense]